MVPDRISLSPLRGVNPEATVFMSYTSENETDALAWFNKKLSYCWETVRRESMPRIANGRGNDNLRRYGLQMYFKVIKRGTNRKLVYDFLLVVYSNICRITHRF